MKENKGLDVLIAVVLSVFTVVSGAVWLGAWTATLLVGHRFTGALEDAPTALYQQLNDPTRPPAQIWGDPNVPNQILVWPLTIVWAVLLSALILVIVRVFLGPTSGFASRRRLGANPEARFATRKELSSLRFRRPAPGRFILGRVGSHTLASVNPRHRDTGLRLKDRFRRRMFSTGRAEAFGAIALIGLSQTGKSQHALTALRALTDSGCPMICSSVKGDVLAQLLAQRRTVGRVGVFDPTGKLRDTYEQRLQTGRDVPPGWDRRLCIGWSPLDGVETYDDAVAAAHRLSEGAPEMDKVSSGDFWTEQAEMLIAPLMWIAARNKRDMGALTLWVLGEARPDPENADAPLPEPLQLLEPLISDRDPATSRDAAKVEHVLYGLWNKAPTTVGSVYATANGILKPWSTEEGRLSSTGKLANLDWLLADSGENTLFISAPPQEQRQLRPVLTGAVSTILDDIYRHVDIHGPLDPPLVVFLDEIGNAPLARLPEYLSTLASSGVLVVTVWQDVAQIKKAYGDNHGSILSNSRHVLLFGGSKDPTTLDWAKNVLGDEGASTLSRTNNVGELLGGSVSSSEQRVSLTPSNVLREMPTDTALLISSNNLPAEVKHIPEYTVTAFERLRSWRHPESETLGLPTAEGRVDVFDGPRPLALGHAFDSGAAKALARLADFAAVWRRRRRPKPGSAEGGPGTIIGHGRPSRSNDPAGQLHADPSSQIDQRDATPLDFVTSRLRRSLVEGEPPATSPPVVLDADSGLENII